MNKKIWHTKPAITDTVAQGLAAFGELEAQLLFNRGLVEHEAASAFLHATYGESRHDPSLLDGMAEAVRQVISSIKGQEQIVIYGDYDADGVTSSAVLYETFKLLKAQVEVYIPDRVSEGYGLNKEALVDIRDMGAKLVITVDNGIRSVDEVAYAKELGLKIIITDHHIPADDPDERPQTIVVNPWLSIGKYPYTPLAGVGVAAKLAMAVIAETKLDADLKLRLEERILDLVALGTVADCVPLTGENRALVKKGLEVINRRKRLGLNELVTVSKLTEEKNISAWNIGFQLAPRLNAAGRLDHANTAFELLVATDKSKAAALALSLNANNTTRQQITEEMVSAIVSGYEQDEPSSIIIAVSPAGVVWNEGVIGLAAGRITERFYRPTLVITGEHGHYKGSGRSIKGLDLISLVSQSSEYLTKFGGHKSACGFSLEGEANLEAFIAKMQSLAAEALVGIDLKPSLEIESALPLNLATEETLASIEAFAPFGEANPRPNFLAEAVKVADMQWLGQESQHLKVRLQQDDSPLKTALCFSAPKEWRDLRIGDTIDIVYYLEINEFNGRREIQLKLVDLKMSQI